MPTLNDYERFFDSIGIDERRREISAVSDPPDLPGHGNDLPSEWIIFRFRGGIELLAGPEESRWLETVCRAPLLAAMVAEDSSGMTHCCALPGRKLWFGATEEAVGVA